MRRRKGKSRSIIPADVVGSAGAKEISATLPVSITIEKGGA